MNINELIMSLRCNGGEDLIFKDEASHGSRLITIQSDEYPQWNPNGWYALWSDREPDTIDIYENEVYWWDDDGYKESQITLGQRPFKYTLDEFFKFWQEKLS